MKFLQHIEDKNNQLLCGVVWHHYFNFLKLEKFIFCRNFGSSKFSNLRENQMNHCQGQGLYQFTFLMIQSYEKSRGKLVPLPSAVFNQACDISLVSQILGERWYVMLLLYIFTHFTHYHVYHFICSYNAEIVLVKNFQVFFYHKLTFQSHVDSICKKAALKCHIQRTTLF